MYLPTTAGLRFDIPNNAASNIFYGVTLMLKWKHLIHVTPAIHISFNIIYYIPTMAALAISIIYPLLSCPVILSPIFFLYSELDGKKI